MVFKNSFKNIVRSKGKSILFFFLIIFLSIILGLGISTWTSINQFLTECYNEYKTIGLFEYMDPEYPDDTIYSDSMRTAIDDFDFSTISNNINAIQWERTSKALGYIDGYTRTDNLMPYRDYAVLVVKRVEAYSTHGKNNAIIIEAPYSYRDKIGKAIVLDPFPYDFNKDSIYVIHGYFSNMINGFALSQFKHNGLGNNEIYPVEDIGNDNNNYIIPDDYISIAKTYNVVNNGVVVFDTMDIESTYYFQQEELYIENGRVFNEDEYINQSKVCVITKSIAKKLNIDIGDVIPLSIVATKNVTIKESYWYENGFTNEAVYTVVGITNAPTSMINYVFIPKSDRIDLLVNQVGYTIGIATLDNNGADEFYKDTLNLLPNRFKLTVYDQGYKAVSEPFKDILNIAIIITLICIIVCLVILVLFGFLFVYRQRDVADTMLKLGAGKAKIIGYFLLGAGMISLFATGLGSLVSFIISKRFTVFINSIALDYIFSNTNFSSSNLSITKEILFNPDINYSVFLYTSLSILFIALISCLIFTLNTFKSKNSKIKKVKIHKVRKSSKLKGGPLKFSILSINRGGARSLVVPIVAIVIVLFLSILSNTVDKYNTELDSIYKDSTVIGEFTDSKGKLTKNAVIEAYQLNELQKTGYIKDLSVSKAQSMYYLGVVVKDGEENEIDPFLPPSGFSAEIFFDAIEMGPKLIYTNSIASAPEFFNSVSVVSNYLEGYDEQSLGKSLNGIAYCMLSSDFIKEKGMELGDTLRIEVIQRRPYTLDLLVIGSYEKQGSKDNIYAQLALYVDPILLLDTENEIKEQLFKYTFDSGNFVIKDTHELESFKEYLYKKGYSQANVISQIRTFIVFEDKELLNTVDHLNQQIRYIGILYPFLYLLVGIISAIISYLVVVIRRKEFGIMRGLGTKKRTTFLSFFYEQAILCLMGCLVGIMGWFIIYRTFNILQLILIVGFILCYFIGSCISIGIMNKSKVLTILKDED